MSCSDVVSKYLPPAYYLEQLPRLLAALSESLARAGLPRLPIFVHVMSQDRRAWEAQMSAWDATLHAAGAAAVLWHLDEDDVSTLTHLMTADVLVGAPSAFSQLAALYSRGAIVAALDESVPTFLYHQFHRLVRPPQCTCRAAGVANTTAAAWAKWVRAQSSIADARTLASPSAASNGSALPATVLAGWPTEADARRAVSRFAGSRHVGVLPGHMCSLWCKPPAASAAATDELGDDQQQKGDATATAVTVRYSIDRAKLSRDVLAALAHRLVEPATCHTSQDKLRRGTSSA